MIDALLIYRLMMIKRHAYHEAILAASHYLNVANVLHGT